MDKPGPAARFEDDPDFDDNPEWTAEDFAKARPASEVLPPHIAAQLTRGDDVALDPDVIAKFRATGPGWQARINAALRAAQV
ncbi:BrnA antitoxin family protein [Sphingomonas sp. A2-49]|uniref:BrnA antitoxin family protein n=1 Tax=Sphingomonas sp. A2-49 TaxID=1391375 RepID=UPI0021D05E45|nr:BrnA antitoxin family protein [Sphingomonas sp. A2-49]MCU6453677.1 BrnA antitoxin family protein [Sphingomonas sp. A2-49]